MTLQRKRHLILGSDLVIFQLARLLGPRYSHLRFDLLNFLPSSVEMTRVTAHVLTAGVNCYCSSRLALTAEASFCWLVVPSPSWLEFNPQHFTSPLPAEPSKIAQVWNRPQTQLCFLRLSLSMVFGNVDPIRSWPWSFEPQHFRVQVLVIAQVWLAPLISLGTSPPERPRLTLLSELVPSPAARNCSCPSTLCGVIQNSTGVVIPRRKLDQIRIMKLYGNTGMGNSTVSQLPVIVPSPALQLSVIQNCTR